MANSSNTILDTTGQHSFCPDMCSEALTYDGSGNLITQTYTDPVSGKSFTKTFTWTAGNYVGSTGWVKQ